MSGSLNKVTLIGTVGKDPEVRSFSNGGRVANFSVATSESWKDKTTGEKKERTEWHRISVWNEGLVSIVEKYVRKGQKLYIEGQMQTRKYEKDGQDFYTTEVILKGFSASLILLSRPKDGSGGGGGGAAASFGEDPYGGKTKTSSGGSFDDALDDEIPF